MLFLILETGMLGAFLSLDFFLFYVFWEVMLLPMYFLIGVWGGPRREYAAMKFFLYTLLGSVFMLIAMLGFTSPTCVISIPRRRWREAGEYASTFVVLAECRRGGLRLSARASRPKRFSRNTATPKCRRAATPASRKPRSGSNQPFFTPRLPVHHVPAVVRRLCHQGAGLCRSIPGCPMPTSKRRRRSP